MWLLYSFQFYLFSACFQVFTVFTYLIYYGDLISTICMQDFKPEYDFIIVGAGTAGSVIAHRLAMETDHTFIVVEAGSKSHALLDAPVLGPFMHQSVFSWQFETTPQDNACLAMNNKKCRLAQGKVIGGSSKLNNMIHIRGNLSQYTSWFHGKFTEDYIREQFNFIENNILHLSHIQYESELSDAVLEAAAELGYERLDYNFKFGFKKNVVSQKNGKRWSTADNLDISKHVLSNALVENVLFDGNTAKGVSVVLPNKNTKIYARKGVILTAGAINSPKILQLSGIGPQELLHSLGIPVLKNLPVGRNLQDHYGSGLDLVLFNKSVSIESFSMINPIHVLNYFINGKGPWTTPGCEVIALLSSNKNVVEQDLQFMVLPVGLASDRGTLLRNTVNIHDYVWENYFSKSFDKYVATVFAVLSQPKSRGYVFINSTDPRLPPMIDPKYLSHKKDRKVLIEGLKLVRKLVETNTVKDLGGYVNPNIFPGCGNFEFYSNAYLDCYISHLTLTSYHPAGTCSMGLPHSSDSVVDTSFKVLGTTGLYVADSSVLPTIPSVNINAAVAMMASIFFDANIKRHVHVRRDASIFSRYDLFKEIVFKVCHVPIFDIKEL